MSATADIKSPPSEQISFNASKTILILCGTIVIFLYLNTAMSPSLSSIAEDFKISQTLASWMMTAYVVHDMTLIRVPSYIKGLSEEMFQSTFCRNITTSGFVNVDDL